MRQKIRPVDVISLCEADGQLRPLRIRYQDEEQIYRKMDVEQVLQRDKICYIGAEAELFLCKATVEGRVWLFQLKYSLRSHSWCMTERIY